jgi:hypothetical protein
MSLLNRTDDKGFVGNYAARPFLLWEKWNDRLPTASWDNIAMVPGEI